ncbi:sulfurtransferase/chromate resistance protein [Labrenzia sp. DG1229]|uniref:chromate resistance protein ChrB domain-containing protein n=1 Tax=Labrenzia sp. DG1229 TaxID=681847 RepID=UPI00048E3056|nr:sulfurtransferase/chromate resistance protein [Labrenzia sp. DG1229]
MPSLNSISISQLSRLIGTPESPVIVDVRIDEDFNDDPHLIPGSFRHPFSKISEISDRLKGRKVAIACWRGLKLSEGVAATLRSDGISAENLEGGCIAWREAGLPMIPAAKLPECNEVGQTVWVTRHRPKIDRIACPWLIRRFVDSNARFLFVSPAQVEAVAEKFNATPFDIEGSFWSHRGEFCSFDTMVEEFALQTDPLSRLAKIVRAADTNRHDLAPEAAGLLAASLGLSRMYRDDLQQLEAGMALYDAFYRWARDAADEGHDWPTATKKG